jgi:carbon starvation protein
VSGQAFPYAVYVVNLKLSPPWAQGIWYLLLAFYGLVASVLPVWILLQPRDYICNWILILGMAFGLVGLFTTSPAIMAPAFTSLQSPKGPLWPMLFIMVACGAVSGFHCLVASGTTAKQLARERQGLAVGYGAMITESVLAVLAVLAVSAGLWAAIGPSAAQDKLASLFRAGGASPIAVFADGYGYFVHEVIGVFGVDPDFALALGAFFGMTMINAFVMTTLDTSVRLGRFVVTELMGPVSRVFRERTVASILTAAPAFCLVSTGSMASIWPMFGAANQLVAGLALIVITAYLVGKGLPGRYTVVPAAFMLLTTLGALVYQGYGFFFGGKPNPLLGLVALVLLVLAICVTVESVRVLGWRPRNLAAGGD